MKVLAYWAARMGVFFGVLLALWLIGWWDLIAVIAAVLIAWLISYLMLPDMRRAAGIQLDGWIEAYQARHHLDDPVEDAEAERARGEN